MDFNDYEIDELGRVNLSENLSAWVDEGTSWRRHWLYHDICRKKFQDAQGGPPPESESGKILKNQGFALAPELLDAATCERFTQSISQYVANKYGALEGLGDTALTATWSHQRAAMFRQALPILFNKDVTSAIEDYFGSYFQVFSVTMNRYLPTPEKDVSFMWHRDSEPPQQLHFMVYLTGASDKGGRTDIVDLTTTRRAAMAGYSFPPIENRKEDIHEVLNDEEEIEVTKPEFGPGGAMIFAAPRTLHRGQLPKSSWRDTILMLLWPSPIPWQERLDNNFASILRDGPHYTSGALNPFGSVSLSTREKHGLPPRWAELGEMFPAEEVVP